MSEIGVFINPDARSGVKKRALEFAKKSDSDVKRLSFPVRDIEGFRTLVVVGGDGSQKGVMDEAINNSGVNFLVVAGGTENGFYRSARMSGAITTSEHILSGDFSALRKFHPGEIEGQIFNHALSFGRHAINLEHFESELRGKIPREMRVFTAGMKEVVRSILEDDVSGNLAKVVVTGSNLGRLSLFPDSDLFSNDLGLASLDGGNKAQVVLKILKILWCIKRGQPIPSDVATWERKEKIDLEIPINDHRVNMDGQIGLVEGQVATVVRSKKSVNLAALKL